MEVGELVRGVLVPTCVVITTPGAEAVCARNGRRVVEVLRSQNTTRTLAARGPNDRTYAVRDFQLRFAELHDFDPRRSSSSSSSSSTSSSPRSTPEDGSNAGGAAPSGAFVGSADPASELYTQVASSSDDAYAPPLVLKDPNDASSFLRGTAPQFCYFATFVALLHRCRSCHHSLS